jgi:hypothetical protein
MFMSGVRRVMVLGILGVGSALPAACLFAPVDYSGGGSTGKGGGCSAAENSNACTMVSCDDTTPGNAPAGSPCLNGVCDGLGTCATCSDGAKNGNETGVDCGGSECPRCDGDACSGVDGDCRSGHCVDGVCCDTGCDQKCEACLTTLTGALSGTCAPLALGTADGSACVSQGGCGVTNLCACEDGVKNQGEVGVDCGGPCSSACEAGTPCQDDFNCTTGACSGGVCCQTHCAGPCEQCDSPGHVGECTPLAPMSAGSCPSTQACDLNGACRKKNGESCANDIECASGLCTTGACSS